MERLNSQVTPQNLLSGALQKIKDLRDVHHLVKTLEEENARLRTVLQQVSGEDGNVPVQVRQLLYSKTGYLNKYRPYATSSLFANTWEPRYIVLKDKSVMYYRNERDVYRNPPRGQLDLENTFVEVEGLKRRKYWTFRVVDLLGVDLIRLSTESHSEMTSWVEALEACGCGLKKSESTSSLQDMLAEAREREGHSIQRQNSGYTSDQSDVAAYNYRPEQFRSMRDRRAKTRKPARVSTGYDGAVPVHTHPKFSLLSSERVRFSDQSGMLTLMFIILAATNARLVLENMLKYGFRFNPFTFIRMVVAPKESTNLAMLVCWPALLIFALFGLLIEQLAASLLKREQRKRLEDEKKELEDVERRSQGRKRVTEWMVLALNVLNTSMTMWVPFHVMTVTKSEPLPSFGLTMVTITLWMKLVSFIHVNWSLRQLHRIDGGRRWPGEALSGSEPLAVETDDMVYPKNLTAQSFAYFLVAPTLCYQLSYPRSPRFRIRWLLRRVVMLSAGLGMMLFITEQYIEPTIDNSIKPLQDMDWLVIVERVLKLSLPTLYFWIVRWLHSCVRPSPIAPSPAITAARARIRSFSHFLAHYVSLPPPSLHPGHVLHAVRALVERPRRTDPVRRPGVLQGLVEFKHAERVLASVEHACPQVDAQTRVLSDDQRWCQQICRGDCGILRIRRAPRGARWCPPAHDPGVGVLGADDANTAHLDDRDAQTVLQAGSGWQRNLLDQFLLPRATDCGNPVLSRLPQVAGLRRLSLCNNGCVVMALCDRSRIILAFLPETLYGSQIWAGAGAGRRAEASTAYVQLAADAGSCIIRRLQFYPCLSVLSHALILPTTKACSTSVSPSPT